MTEPLPNHSPGLVGCTAPINENVVFEYGPDRQPTLQERMMASRLGRAALAGLAAFSLLTVTAAAGESATEEHVYTVTGTDGEGVWLHSDPGLGDEDDLIKRMPDGTEFTADCYVVDTPIGPRDNPVWLHGHDPEGDVGYFTDYYSDSKWDSENTLQDQGLPLCGEQDNQESDETGYSAVFYAPGDGETVYYNEENVPMPVSDDVYVMAKEGDKHPKWTEDGVQCGVAHADDFENHVLGARITTLAGWSIGRLGPVYYLKNGAAQEREAVDYILLIDPGNKKEFEDNRCDREYDQSQAYADWLAEDSSNQLTILAGSLTEDAQHPDNGYAHAGIQNVLFGRIRGTDLAQQVLVCNYPGVDHVPMFDEFRDDITGPKITSPDECPASPAGGEVVGWRP